MNKIRKFFSREYGYSGIVESLMGSVITFLAMTGTALAINSSLQTTLAAQNYSKAAGYIQETFSIAKSTNYNQLGTNQSLADSANIVQIAKKDINGCNPFVQNYEDEVSLEDSKSQIPHCQIKQQSTGISFNVETHVTRVGLNEITQDFTSTSSLPPSTLIHAKRVTVIVTWWDGTRDANDLPVLQRAESEMVLTPTIGFCPPSSAGLAGGCD
jgi:hypothetical protein